MEFWNLFIVLLAIVPNKVLSNELLELSCKDDMECKQFQHDGVQPKCIEGHCQCTTNAAEHIKCKPMKSKLSNIIGGNCPCTQLNAECYEDRCYCAIDFTPSTDKRRCLKKTAFLGDSCELDLQCQKTDYNAICPPDMKHCVCMEQFVNDNKQCLSTIGSKFKCKTTVECIKQFGNNSQCHTILQKCICSEGFVTAINNSVCLSASTYLKNCEENSQCIVTMGPGSKCIDGVCECDGKYYPEEINKNDTLQTVCTGEVELGQYCRLEQDCYNRYLNGSEQTMDCVYGECSCKFGFYSINNGICMRSSSASELSKLSIFLCFVFFIYFSNLSQ
uniref:EB domain-containing protein n=1 Tax=Glossina brevipalpis TaxID=37001 RepID=A0A1A9W6B2_9MUSC